MTTKTPKMSLESIKRTPVSCARTQRELADHDAWVAECEKKNAQQKVAKKTAK